MPKTSMSQTQKRADSTQGSTQRRRKPYQTKRTWKAKFLKMLADTGNVRLACKAVRIERSTAYKARDADPEFRAKWDEMIENACDLLEAEAWRRGVYGTLKPVFYKGMLCTDRRGQPTGIQEYSDTLLALLLRGHRPDKYRERVEHTGRDGEPITLRVVYDDDHRADGAPATAAPAAG